ncbi:MAG TPA: hypothetical protein VG939_15795 [Caulobacteraceae bacterium]|nr:hypothetical protein [Caulobacteraceae bacterium]
MVEQAIVYLIVAAAAGWAAWSLFLRGMVRRARAKSGAANCGPDCACGD